MEVLGDEKAFAVQTVPAPERVETAVAGIWRGRRLMTPIGGGVNIQARLALNSANQLDDEQGAVMKKHATITLDHLKPGDWWWD
jgi:hypothetical protein